MFLWLENVPKTKDLGETFSDGHCNPRIGVGSIRISSD